MKLLASDAIGATTTTAEAVKAIAVIAFKYFDFFDFLHLLILRVIPPHPYLIRKILNPINITKILVNIIILTEK
ncbi:hypothetical protein LFU01_05010 [Lysinibacillus fusiformis]|nr:hypothetical protein LFU01_05010 [Lysinibacillus fusiformis]